MGERAEETSQKEQNGVLKALSAAFAALRPLWGGRANAAVELHLGILQVAVLVAALDGDFSASEYAAIEAQAKTLPGVSADLVRRAFDAALRQAGFLAVLTRVTRYTVEDRLAAFDAAVRALLPNGFATGRIEDVRYAFVVWTAIALADGEFSEIERTALDALKWQFDGVRTACAQSDVAVLRGTCAVTRQTGASLHSEDFVSQARALLKDLGENSEGLRRFLSGL